ncbi:MAG: AMP-binding protein [Burkholderiales bacterium]|nr:AMP-binding protein [Burkholderiales bacterium]
MRSDLLSISQAASEFPNRLAVRAKGIGNLSFKEISELTQKKKARYSDSKAPVPLVAEGSMDSLTNIYALLELHRPIILIHPASTEEERKAIFSFVDNQSSPLPIDTAIVIFTSGTSGNPKPVILSRRALIASALSSAKNIPLSEEDVYQLSIPPARIGGFSIITRSLIAGSAISLAPKFDPFETTKSWDEDGVTLASVVPAMLMRVMEECPEWRPKGNFRSFLVGGAPTSEKLRKKAKDLSLPLIMTYGMTETSSNVVSTPYALKDQITFGCGTLNANAEMKIENEDIYVRGPMLADGYWGRDDFLTNGWFYTGDRGYIDSDGFVHVKGRRSDSIVTAGNNVDPIEVEHALESIAGIKRALVLGKPDDTWGEIVVALLVPESKTEELTASEIVQGLEKKLAKYKSPRRYEWVEELPQTKGGKPNRHPSVLEGLSLKTIHYTVR